FVVRVFYDVRSLQKRELQSSRYGTRSPGAHPGRGGGNAPRLNQKTIYFVAAKIFTLAAIGFLYVPCF
ncbi:MAG TPA: hypothetical protein VFO93_12760, partial [Hymenobacter sp.]|uniref:hypothetical protein n=1 Tax=Hymenobacter sp. TaxID=1898978 RepID=UPI002D80AEF3